MNDVLKKRKNQATKYLLMEDILLSLILGYLMLDIISYFFAGNTISDMMHETSAKTMVGNICVPFLFIYEILRIVCRIMDRCMSKTKVKRVSVLRVYHHRVYFFLIIKSFLSRKNCDIYCMKIQTTDNQTYFLDESILGDVNQTIHDWSDLEESQYDFEIEYLKYSRIVVRMKHLLQ